MISVGGDRLDLVVRPLGARITSLRVRLSDGTWREVTAGLASDEEFLASDRNQGATIGRVANRIRGGDLTVDGRRHRLLTNDRGNTLHGGPDGFARREWTVVEAGADRVVLELVSPDGDQGFPGTVTVRATYEVAGTALHTTYAATTDAPTPVALTSHPYFRLADRVTDHRISVRAHHYLPVDEEGLPIGIAPVAGTGFDLREPTPVSPAYDHCWVLGGDGLRTVAVLEGGGLALAVATDQPGLQVYGGAGLVEGVAIEPQHHPDAVHHPDWPSVVLRPGEDYRWRSVLTFRGTG